MQKMQTERTSFPNAVKTILEKLKEGKAYSISHLAEETNLNRRTVEKALELLTDIQKSFMKNNLDIVGMKRGKIVQLTDRRQLLGLTEELQKLIIRTNYFPTPSREEEILVFLFLKHACSPENAVSIQESGLVEKLLEQGQILESSGGLIYLSDEGQIVAKGALKLYPELKEITK